MKKGWLLAGLLSGTVLLAGCGQHPVSSPAGETGRQELEAADTQTIQVRIVDGAETGDLVLAGEHAGDVYVLPIKDLPVLLDGQPAQPDVLKDGMMAEIQFDGQVLYSYPAQLSQRKSIAVSSQGGAERPADRMTDLCGLYLRVLEELWNSDDREGIQQVGVDLSQAPGGLTEGEKSAIAWVFGNAHGIPGFCTTMKELKEDDILTPLNEGDDLFQWEDGALFSITAVAPRGCAVLPPEPGAESCEQIPQESGNAMVLELNAQSWRSPLGAVFLSNCSAVWSPEGSWTFTPGMIAMA